MPHGPGFKYVRAVPEDLRSIENKSAWVRCLGSVSRLEAETLAHGLAYEHGKRILALRALRRGGGWASGSAQIRDLSALILNPIPTVVAPGANTPGAGLDEEAGMTLGPSLLDLVKLWGCIPLTKQVRPPILIATEKPDADQFDEHPISR